MNRTILAILLLALSTSGAAGSDGVLEAGELEELCSSIGEPYIDQAFCLGFMAGVYQTLKLNEVVIGQDVDNATHGVCVPGTARLRYSSMMMMFLDYMADHQEEARVFTAGVVLASLRSMFPCD